ncbi:MAG: hypothetical protein ACI9JL_004481 [Paracoccaceae bacterium]|jgi:hypothetical protein
MQAFSRRCLTRLVVAILALVLIPVGVQAGPTVHSAAKPGFQDPLSSARPAAPTTDLAINPNRDVGADSVRIPLEADVTPLGNSGDGALEEVQTDDIARTVRDEFLGQGSPATNRNAETDLDSLADQPDGSSASILQTLINSVPGESAANSAPRENPNGSNATSSLLDATLNNLIITILNPELATEGMVTFSIAGFGEFALLLLQESGGIFLVDMESGTAVKFSETIGTVLDGPISANRGAAGQQDRAPSNALQRVLELLERNVLPIITSPITLATIMLFGIIWVVWRLSARG